MHDRDDSERPPSTSSDTHGGRFRAAIHRAVPSHFQDPVGLTLRILKSGNRDAIEALFQAGIRLGLSPVDALLAWMLRRTEDAGIAPSRPVLFVTGPPRSGTTLLHQLLIRHLSVAYVTNLASLMPRSAQTGAWPLTASMNNQKVRLESYYGRTRALSGPSDGLEFWDAWAGEDRLAVPTSLPPGAMSAMRRFFGHLERNTGRPVVAKNNNLIAFAHLVGAAMPTARFVCLRRDPVYLAQSLLTARNDIHGTRDVSYGIDDRTGTASASANPVADVWRQVGLYRDMEARQASLLGADRFIVIDYEELCADPSEVVGRLGRDVLGLNGLAPDIAPLNAMRRRTLTDDEFNCLTTLAAAHEKTGKSN